MTLRSQGFIISCPQHLQDGINPVITDVTILIVTLEFNETILIPFYRWETEVQIDLMMWVTGHICGTVRNQVGLQ